jgi:hypothetical protein
VTTATFTLHIRSTCWWPIVVVVASVVTVAAAVVVVVVVVVIGSRGVLIVGCHACQTPVMTSMECG